MLKTKNEFLEHFARLGVFSKVQALMDDGDDSENSMDVVIKSPTTANEATTASVQVNEASTSTSVATTADVKGFYHHQSKASPKRKSNRISIFK